MTFRNVNVHVQERFGFENMNIFTFFLIYISSLFTFIYFYISKVQAHHLAVPFDGSEPWPETNWD